MPPVLGSVIRHSQCEPALDEVQTLEPQSLLTRRRCQRRHGQRAVLLRGLAGAKLAGHLGRHVEVGELDPVAGRGRGHRGRAHQAGQVAGGGVLAGAVGQELLGVERDVGLGIGLHHMLPSPRSILWRSATE